jgi:hypothetical protein
LSTQIPAEVIAAIQSGTTTVTRRAEIYEADAKTKWDPEGDTLYTPRIMDGSITVDYNRDERRAGDFSFDNRDGALRPDPYSGFWYDKIIKIFRGVEYATKNLSPKILICDAPDYATGYAIRALLATLGFDNCYVSLNGTYAAAKNYDIFVSYNPTGGAVVDTVFKQAYQAGKGVMTFGNQYTTGNLPFITTTGSTVVKAVALTPTTFDNPLRGGWTAQTTTTTDSTLLITGLGTDATAVATDLDGATTHYTAIVAANAKGGRWFHFAPHQIQSQGKILIRKAVEWIRDWKPTAEWELQTGEFMIDNFKQKNRPRVMNVTCRDMTKKMLGSKLEKSTSFAKGTPIIEVVRALAANSGITKLRLPVSGKVLGARVDLERGTPRWKVAKDICTANNYELFFDRQGYLTMREFIDPSFGPITQVFKTGKISEGGNLVEYEKSADDSRLFNHIIVVGERENDSLLPFFAEIKNTNPASPTRIDRIGDRLMDPIVGTYFTSNAQCFETAHNMMKVAALESYQLAFSSIMYQWLECGEVIKILDPDALPTEPDRYLLDTLTLPMALGPMSGTGKRVTIVQDDDYIRSTNDPVDPGMVSGASG